MPRILAAVLTVARSAHARLPRPRRLQGLRAQAGARQRGQGRRRPRHRPRALRRRRPRARRSRSGAARGASAPEAARAFLRRHGKAFGVADAARDVRVAGSRSARGRSTVRFQQLHDGVPVVGGELVGQPRPLRQRALGDGRGRRRRRLEGAARDRAKPPGTTAIATVAKRARGVRGAAARDDAEPVDLRLEPARRPRAAAHRARLAARGQGHRGPGGRPAGARRRRARRRRARHRSDRARAPAADLRRQQHDRRRRLLPVHEPDRQRRHRRHAAARRRRRRRRPRTGSPRRPTTSTTSASAATASTARACRSSPPSTSATPSRLPDAERVLGRRADGLRRRLRGRRRRGGPRADARRHRLQRPPLLLLPIGRDQRVAVRRHGRVDRPDQRRGQRLGRGQVADRRGPADVRRDPQHGQEPATGCRVQRPGLDDEPELHGRSDRAGQRRRPHQQRRQQQGRLPDHRRRHVRRPRRSPAWASPRRRGSTTTCRRAT